MSAKKILPEREWLDTLPAKVIGAKVALVTSQAKVLLLQPTYHDRWELVGGVVEKNETPLGAAIRETEEEVGLKIEMERLRFRAINYHPSVDSRRDLIQILFVVDITSEEANSLQIRAEEIAKHQFVAVEELAQPEYARIQILRTLYDVLHHRHFGYFESGRFMPEISNPLQSRE